VIGQLGRLWDDVPDMHRLGGRGTISALFLDLLDLLARAQMA
jgi:hypothetical protein